MKIFCIIGDERAFHSKSPVMFSSVMKRVGIRGEYVPFKVKPRDIGSAVESLRVLNIDGANVTIPHKETVPPFLDSLSESANTIGAVNTIVRIDDKLKGYNTNATGFRDALESFDFKVDNKSVLVFGTGGAAKSVSFILNWLRAGSITIAGRDNEKMGRVADQFSGEAKSLTSLPEQPLSANLVVNATSVSSPDESIEMAALVSQLEMRDCELIIDLNYGRKTSFWRTLAESAGIKYIDGLPILAHQAKRCFALWTKIEVEPSEFIDGLE